MKNTSRKLTIKDYCNHLGSLHSSAKSVTTKGKLPLPVFGYPYPYLVALSALKPIYLCNLNKKHALFRVLQRKSLQKNSYPSPTFSYPLSVLSYLSPYLVTLHPYLVTLLSTFSYPLSVFSYPLMSDNRITAIKTACPLKLLINSFIEIIVRQRIIL